MREGLERTLEALGERLDAEGEDAALVSALRRLAGDLDDPDLDVTRSGPLWAQYRALLGDLKEAAAVGDNEGDDFEAAVSAPVGDAPKP